MHLLGNELRNPNRCQHEHVDTRLLAENKSLQESINILNADNQLLSTKVAELSNRLELQVLNSQNQDQVSDFVEVRSKKKKKKSKSPQGQQAATGMDQEHQERFHFPFAEKLVDLGNLFTSSSPSKKVTISALTQRFDDESPGEKNGMHQNHQTFLQPKRLGSCPTPKY